MKRLIRSSYNVKNLNYVKSSVASSYTDHYTLRIDGQRFSVYTKYADDPDNFQCQISELHPYDLAEYAWCKKDSPVSATVYKDGKRYGYIEIDEWDEDYYKNDSEKYVRDIVNYMCRQLRAMNNDVKPIIDKS